MTISPHMTEEDPIDRALAAHLGRVQAPEALWEGVARRIERRDNPRWRRVRLAAAAVAVAVICWVLTPRPDAFARFATAAHGELSNAPARLDLRTASAEALRNWAASAARLQVALRPASGRVELIGARLIPYRREWFAAISYRVIGQAATLLIGPASKAGATRPTVRARAGELTVYTWRSGGQTYALVTPRHDRQACLICHSS